MGPSVAAFEIETHHAGAAPERRQAETYVGAWLGRVSARGAALVRGPDIEAQLALDRLLWIAGHGPLEYRGPGCAGRCIDRFLPCGHVCVGDRGRKCTGTFANGTVRRRHVSAAICRLASAAHAAHVAPSRMDVMGFASVHGMRVAVARRAPSPDP